MKASGVNSHTRKQLRDLMAEGYGAEEISSMIQVEQEAVENWMKYFEESGEVTVESVDVPIPTLENSLDEIAAFAKGLGIEVDDSDTKEGLLDVINASD